MSVAIKKNDAKNELRLLGSQIQQLSKTSILETCKSYATAWTIIIMSGFVLFANPELHFSLKFFLSIAIATQLHGLLVLMHGAAHWHFCNSKTLNNWISDILSAWPLLVSTDSYREHHHFHHQYTNTEKDPDWARRIEKSTWQYPMAKSKFYKVIAPYFLGAGLIEMLLIQFILNKNLKNNKVSQLLYRAFFTATFFTLLYFLGTAAIWVYFVPTYIILPFLMRIRSIAEHWGLTYQNEFEDSRNIHAGAIEKILFGPFENNLHLVHHLLPSVPWYRAKEAHQILCKIPQYKNANSQTYGYFMPAKEISGKTFYEQITY